MKKWQQVRQKFEAFEPRERMLLIGAALGFVYFLWEFAFYNARAEAIATLRDEQQAIQQSLQKAEAEKQVLSGLVARDPFANLRRELAQLQENSAALDQKLQTLSAGLISPADLPKALQDVLLARPQVRLIELNTLATEEVMLSDWSASSAAAGEEKPAEQAPVLYRHGVKIVFESTFGATLEYLAALEQGSWQFYWDNIHYRVKQYPLAQITLDVYTLSAAKGGWHGND